MMSSSDAIIWNIENDPHLQSTVMSVWILDQVPTPERMAANVDRMVASIPRLRQRVVDGRPRPSWDPIDDLDLAQHVVHASLPDGSSLDDVLAYAQDWVRQPFVRDRPLWRLGLLTGLADGKAAIVIKVHHAIADGMGMLLMLGAFTDFERDPLVVAETEVVHELPDKRKVFTPTKRAVTKTSKAAGTFIRRPIDSIYDLGRTLKSAFRIVTPHRTPHSNLMTERSSQMVMDTRTIDFATFKARADTDGVSLNDLFVSVIADAVTDYHEESGVACPRLRVHMPVDIRTGRTANLAGNQFVPARVSLDVRAAPGSTRRSHIAMQLETLCNEPALGHINTVSAAIQRLGKPISRWIISGMMKGIDILASNVPGPDFPLYTAGAQIEQFFGFGPPAGAALNATLFSYDGKVRIGLTIDSAAISDLPMFSRCLDRVIDEAFYTTTTELLAS